MTIKLGIAPINWCNDDDPNLGGDISFEQCIDEMALAGYVGTELGNKYPRDAALLKDTLAARGLQLSSAWFSTYFTVDGAYSDTLARFMEHLSFMRAMGAGFINVCECGHAIQGSETAILSPFKPEFSEQQWAALVKGLHALGRIAHDYGMQVVYHYHAGTGVFTGNEIDALMERTSPELVGLLLDTGHAAFAGVDSLRLIEQYSSRISYVHLKDVRAEVLKSVSENNLNFMDAVRAGVFTVPGDGFLDFSAIIKGLKKSAYSGWMIVEAEQDPVKAPPLQYALKAYKYLSEIV